MKKPTAKNLFERIDQGVKEGVARALEEHRKAGSDVFIWREGRITRVSASRIKSLLGGKPSASVKRTERIVRERRTANGRK